MTRKSIALLNLLVCIGISIPPVPAYTDPSKSDPSKARAAALTKELQDYATSSLKKLHEQDSKLKKSKTNFEERIKLLKHISTLEDIFNLEDKETDQELVELLKSMNKDPREQIRRTIAHLYSSSHYQTDEQETKCKVTLQRLLNETAKGDPCLEVMVLSRWIGWFPTLTGIRKQLIETLPNCTATDEDSLRIRMNGCLWASGYLYTNHVLYQPPKTPKLLQQAYDLAVQLKDPSEIVQIRDLLQSDKWTSSKKETSAVATSECEQLLLALKILGDTIEDKESKRLIVSNFIRNELIQYALTAPAADAKKVISAWLPLIHKIPGNSYECPEESGIAALYAYMMRGFLDLILNNYDEATKDFEGVITRAKIVLDEEAKPVDFSLLKNQTLQKIDQLVNDSGLDRWESNPIDNVSMLQHRDRGEGTFRAKTAISMQTLATAGLAALNAKQNRILPAEKFYKQLLDRTGKKGDYQNYDKAIAGVSALVADALASKDPKAAASYYERAWNQYTGSRRSKDSRLDNLEFKRGLGRPSWPPMSIPPTKGFSDAEDIVLRAVPNEKTIAENYIKLLDSRKELYNSKMYDAVKARLSQLEADDKEHARLMQLYELDIEEHAIANQFKSDRPAAFQNLRSVIEKRRSNRDSRLVSSLWELGRQYFLDGNILEALMPLAEALKLGDSFGPEYELYLADPETLLGQCKLEMGNNADAEKSLKKALKILAAEKHEEYQTARNRLILAECLTKSQKFDESRNELDAIAKYYSTFDKKTYLLDELAALCVEEAFLCLASNKPEEAQKKLKTAADWLKQMAPGDETDWKLRFRMELLFAECDLRTGALLESGKHLNAAQHILKNEGNESELFSIQLAEANARLAIANRDVQKAKEYYEKILASLEKSMGSDCPRAVEIKKVMSKL